MSFRHSALATSSLSRAQWTRGMGKVVMVGEVVALTIDGGSTLYSAIACIPPAPNLKLTLESLKEVLV